MYGEWREGARYHLNTLYADPTPAEDIMSDGWLRGGIACDEWCTAWHAANDGAESN